MNGEKFVEMNRLLRFVKEKVSILEECGDCDGIAMGLLMALFDKASPTHNMVASWLIFTSPVNDKHTLAETKTKQKHE